MDVFERTAYAILIVIACAWLGVVIFGSIAAFPYGVPGLLAILAIGTHAM